MKSKRVVITGIGLVSPLGCGNIEIWNKIIKSESGISKLDLGISDIPISIAGQVKDFNEVELFGKQSMKQRSRSTHFALYASDIALKDAEFHHGKGLDLNRCGVAIASGMGCLKDITEAQLTCQDSYRKLSPYFVSKILLNMAAGEVSIKYKLRGPNHCVTTACTAGAHAIGDAYNFIRLGYADLMVAGGTEAPLDPLSIGAFHKMRALSRNDDPATASRPFDKNRDGFVISEGSAILVLESLESALKRGVRIYAEISGYGLSGDGNHITSPPETGDGAIRSMKSALSDANISPDSIGYINAHATSTPLGDVAEINAIDRVFSQESWPAEPSELSPINIHKQIPSFEYQSNNNLYVSSTKGSTGHMLGAAGAIESAITIFSLYTHILPPTLNLSFEPLIKSTSPTTKTVEDDSKHDNLIRSSFQHVPQKALHLPSSHQYRYAMSNSFGFGGTNASLIFKKYH